MSSHTDRTTTDTLGLTTFACTWCGLTVSAYAADGEPRNHCPSCLHSRHVLDHVEGGPSDCEGRMSAIAIAVLRTGEWMVVHRCVRCDELTSNPVRTDDNQLILMRMAVRPLAQPPFPLEAFGTL
ncbi:RNHCP domain-containing protein [Streptomyces bacillaris]|uniref:RNHCP domain-containing protein n=1 Tax=Streptomyces cavourensis TaxID=67258 RepID=A0AAD0Q612_9ACTN|nr:MULTISPECIES: RNHCP domain-containing protein [Streptomyces]NUW21771.1 RNHCP domain-containing protein [Streptomyces roseoviolaceus]ATY96659.1 RNHCP domain protein [Streptomyces cavourensis]AXI72504.1 RNHCP domain-containing protein [Streptomyces cavourensis]NUV43147.1 RNHCP domain-containing protein [Streptomyces sp. CAI-24]NUV81392.1 RNHCP domain-containing protein [Streptomyces sp. CAI-155]